MVKAITRLLSALFLVVASMIYGASAKPTPVQIWHVGDDVLSQRLFDHVEKAFKAAQGFALNSDRQVGTLVVTIPTNVDWTQDGKRTRVIYRVEFSTSDGLKLGSRRGSCWDDQLEKCAAQIVSGAQAALKRPRPAGK